MVGGEVAMEVRVLFKHGKGVRQIARELGVSRNTVRRYLREPDASRYRARRPRAAKLEPFKAFIAERAAAAPARIPAEAMLRELRPRGYTGGLTQLRAYLASLVPAKAADPVMRFETEPGQQMQADWATIRRGTGRLSVFVATLGWSRAAYVEFVPDEQADTLIRCHEHAFGFFGGVPREVLYDNAKTVVVERDAYGPGRHRFHPALADFAGHCGFRPRLCQPYRARTKGKVERFIRYLRGSLWVPLAARYACDGLVVDQHAANAAARCWLDEVANLRVHATTGEVPSARLMLERERLQPVPPAWSGRMVRPEQRRTPMPVLPLLGLQHPLSVYEQLMGAGA